jgi:hypothetical protein
MRRTKGIFGLVAGVFIMLAALVTLGVGGLGSGLSTDGTSAATYLGWSGVGISFVFIILGALAVAPLGKVPSVLLITCAIAGAILGGTLVAICMVLALSGGVLAVIGGIGGAGSASSAAGASTAAYVGWGGLGSSFLSVILGALGIAVSAKAPGVLLIVCAIAGTILGSAVEGICMVLVLIGSLLAAMGGKSEGTELFAAP